MNSNKNLAVSFVPIIIIGFAFGVYLSLSVVGQNPTTVNYSGFSTSGNTTSSSIGLELFVSINSTHLISDQGISINITEYNILPRINNVSAASNWSNGVLSLGPCGPLNYPFGAEVFSGYYTSSNISSATPLGLVQEGVPIMCPAIFHVLYYVFQPMSNNGSINIASNSNGAVQCCSSSIGQASPITGALNVRNYWDKSNNKHNLESGVYTILAGDEWGQSVVLHFAVLPVTASNSSEFPVDIVSVIGPIPPYNPGGAVVQLTLEMCQSSI